ncbi:MAG: 4a-hydroxytetrahydrobiopterin dehydratase [Planctomycetaceae bacterium]|nr:MAG: 4a-hydroxytetrahydrobiopterin dehydratase [Planctomycetaceae bacterium]
MESDPTDTLARRHCVPCEGGVEKLTVDQVRPLLAQVPLWQIDEPGDSISRKFKFRDFVSAMAFLQQVADLAEEEQHHPDLHLTGYRHVRIELMTHAIGGLSDNDLIMAAKIDEVAPD